MPNDVTPNPLPYDEALARFTDQRLDQNPSAAPQPEMEDPALSELQRTVELMWTVLGQEEPGHTLRERIHQNLVAEWRDMETSSRSALPFWMRWLPRLSVGTVGVARGGAMLAAAVSVLLLVIGVGLAAAPSTNEIAGAASGTGPIALIAVGTGGLVIALVWLLRSNHS